MERFREIFNDLVVETLQQSYEFIVEFGPRILFALLIIALGWVFAVIVKKVISKLLRFLGLDVLVDKTGFKRLLERGDIKRRPSSMIGLIFYWLILIDALIMASNTLNISIASQFVRGAVLYIPRIIISTVIIGIGIYAGRIIGNLVDKTTNLADIAWHSVLGKATYYALVGLAIILAVDSLDPSVSFIKETFLVVFVIGPAIFLTIFVMGGRDVISSILARKGLMNEYKRGDKIAFDSIAGEIESVDFLITRLKNGDEEIIVPNAELARKIVRKKTTAGG